MGKSFHQFPRLEGTGKQRGRGWERVSHLANHIDRGAHATVPVAIRCSLLVEYSRTISKYQIWLFRRCIGQFAIFFSFTKYVSNPRLTQIFRAFVALAESFQTEPRQLAFV